MIRKLGVVVTVVGLIAITAAEIRSKHREQNRKAEEVLVNVERQLAEASLRGDVDLMNRVMADDFIGIDHLGQEMTKPQILARFASPDITLETLRHENIRVRVYGDCAVATARTVMKARYKGQETSGVFPYLRVWIRRGGRWQAVATQSTSIPNPPPESQ